MMQCPGDPTNFLETTSAERYHTPCTSVISLGASFAAVGCTDGVIFVYRLPLLYISNAFSLPFEQCVNELVFTPCAYFLIAFQQIGPSDQQKASLRVFLIEIAKIIQRYDMQRPVLEVAPITWCDEIANVFLNSVVFTHFYYRGGEFYGFELLMHTDQGVIVAYWQLSCSLKCFAFFEQFGPRMLERNVGLYVSGVMAAFGKVYFIYTGDVLYTFTRSSNMLGFEAAFAGMLRLDSGHSDAEGNVQQQTLLYLYTFCVVDMDSGTAYASYEDMQQRRKCTESSPASFAVLYANELHLLLIDVVPVENHATFLAGAEIPSEYLQEQVSTHLIAPTSYNGVIPLPTRSDGVSDFLVSEFFINMYEITSVSTQALRNVQCISQTGTCILVAAANGTAHIDMQNPEQCYQMHNFSIPCRHTAMVVANHRPYAIYCFYGKMYAPNALKSIAVQRKLQFYKLTENCVKYRAKALFNPALISIPIRFQEFGALVNGFKAVGYYTLYVEREDEYDVDEDTILYPPGSQQRSIETIRQQVEGLKGWTEDLLEEINLGEYY